MKIGTRTVGRDKPVLVIAEIGVNHDGQVDRAIELIRAAADAGADAVKLQIFQADRLMHRDARFAEYQSSRTDAADPIAMLRQYELSDSELTTITSHIDRAGLTAIATPFSPDDVNRVVAIGSAAIKIASPDLVNRLLLTHAIETRLPLILSTGAATVDEIDSAVAWLNQQKAGFALLHCISSYPTPIEDAHLGWITELSRFGVPVGYSDHSTELDAGAMAVLAGACIVEKHLTYDTTASGPDHSASLDPEQFRDYVQQIRRAEKLRGWAGRRVLDCERDVRTVSRQSLVLKRNLNAGDVIQLTDLTTQRPADGISAERAEDVVGKRTKSPQSAGTMLQPDMIEGFNA